VKDLVVYSIIALLITWFILSILFQFNFKWLAYINKYDSFGFLPKWNFFAPNPETSDYHLLYRNFDQDNGFDSWIEIPITEKRKIYSVIWNPEQRSKMILLTVASIIATTDWEGTSKPSKLITLSLPYLILLNLVVHHGNNTNKTISRQFVLVETAWEGSATEPKILLLSALHPLK